MGIIKNNFWSITAVYSVGFLYLRAISFLLLPLYTNLLSTLEAGYVFILYTIIAFLNTLYNHGMDSSLLKYFKNNNDSKIITTAHYKDMGPWMRATLDFFNDKKK